MSRRFTILATFPMGNEGDGIEVEITYNYTRGYPMIAPSFNSPGEPAEGDEVEFVSCCPVSGSFEHWPEAQKCLDDWASEALADELYENACDNASEDAEP